jgi:hypothetical protein
MIAQQDFMRPSLHQASVLYSTVPRKAVPGHG